MSKIVRNIQANGLTMSTEYVRQEFYEGVSHTLTSSSTLLLLGLEFLHSPSSFEEDVDREVHSHSDGSLIKFGLFASLYSHKQSKSAKQILIKCNSREFYQKTVELFRLEVRQN